ncbi:glutamate--cysteine ligase [Recurvomyces mirabilis]|nr:glutamate--cysteine ligase [Recurvomyces mirabilis]
MDATSRRPQLPALSYLDIGKVKREEEAYQSRHGGNAQTLPSVTAASPTYAYPSGPPPPYSQPAPASTLHASAWPSTTSAHTPPESRRASEEDAKQKQSLPSISEALGVDSQTSYQSHTRPAVAPASPLSAGIKRYGMEPPPAPTVHTSTGAFAPHRHEPPSALHLQTSQSAPLPALQQPAYSYPPTSSPSSTSTSSFTYGYTPYPSRYAQPPPSTTSAANGPIYQPSASHPAPQTPSTSWRSESSTKFVPSEPATGPGDYSASVKRHLDLYDLEGALNEISQSSSILTDFSRRYGDRLHQTARSGTPLGSLPGLVEVNDMVQKSRTQVEALLKIREVVLAQQAAYDQQIAEQRPSKHHITEPAPPSHDPDSQDVDESKVGFAGSDTKKRRGRAAPPGRCHSCNRAETPEWRRGPDGARTLCNACGLHYAKLTRKQQGVSKSASSSNLRPKEA